APRVLSPREADRVDLVQEEDARGRAARLLEDVVEVLLADPDEGVEDLLDAHVREREPTLRGRRPGEERLATARRAVEKHAAAGLPAVALVQIGPLEREDDRTVDGLLDILEAAHVRESGRAAGFELDEGRGAVGTGVTGGLRHSLEPEGSVDLLPGRR